MTTTIQKTNKFSLADLDLKDFGHTVQLVGMVWGAHDGNLLITSFPDETFSADALIDELVLTVEDFEKVLFQSDVLETEMIGPERAIVRKSQRMIDSNVSWAVYERDGYRCRYCGKKGPLSVDHVDLWEAGGVSVVSNLISACRQCNRRRGRTPYADWLKSEYYLKVSKSLDDKGRSWNDSIVANLGYLETLRTTKQRSR